MDNKQLVNLLQAVAHFRLPGIRFIIQGSVHTTGVNLAACDAAGTIG
jgi:hypothetical protein